MAAPASAERLTRDRLDPCERLAHRPCRWRAMASAFQAFPPKPSSVGARSASFPVACIRTPTRTSPSGVLTSRRRADAGS